MSEPTEKQETETVYDGIEHIIFSVAVGMHEKVTLAEIQKAVRRGWDRGVQKSKEIDLEEG